MQLQINKFSRLAIKVLFMLSLLMLSVIVFLILNHEPGLTVFIEDIERRGILRNCLTVAGVEFDVVESGGFKARAGFDDRMRAVWSDFDNYRTPSMDRCREHQHIGVLEK